MTSGTAIKIVTSAAELASALLAARGGETILLADGDYGSLTLSTQWNGRLKKYDETVTIAALNPGQATFDRLEIATAKNLALDGLVLNTALVIGSASSGVSVRNSEIALLSVRDSSDIEIAYNDIGHGRFGVILQGVRNAVVHNNYIHEVTEDLVRVIGASSNVVIEDNLLYDVIATAGTHADLIQMYGYGGVSPQDITIRGNILYDDPATGAITANAQGIFISDPHGAGFQDILIEQNMVWVTHPNTIFMVGGTEDVLIQDNSLIGLQGHNSARIRLDANNGGVTVDGNVVRQVLDVGGGVTVGDNYSFGSGPYGYSYRDQTDIYRSPAYIGWESFLPVAGSAIDFGSSYGAQERLRELLAGIDNDFGTIRLLFENAGTTQVFQRAAPSPLAFGHDETLAITEGTVTMSFVTNITSGHSGLMSKNGGGLDNGLLVFIENGALRINFEDDSGTQSIIVRGIRTYTEYDLVISFEPGLARAWLDGQLVGSVETNMDWTQNTNQVTVGALDGNEAQSVTKFFLSGSVSNLRIYDTAMDIDLASALVEQRDSHLAAAGNDGDWSKVAYYYDGRKEFGALGDTIKIDPGALSLSEATIVTNFNADNNSWYRGLIAKDSLGLGDGFSAFLREGRLVLRFEDDDGVQTIESGIVDRYVYHNLIVSFEDGVAEAWLNGNSLGQVATGMDWTQNSDTLMIGAMNLNSQSGTTSAANLPFDGRINGFLVLDEGMTPTEVAAYIDANPHLVV